MCPHPRAGEPCEEPCPSVLLGELLYAILQPFRYNYCQPCNTNQEYDIHSMLNWPSEAFIVNVWHCMRASRLVFLDWHEIKATWYSVMRRFMRGLVPSFLSSFLFFLKLLCTMKAFFTRTTRLLCADNEVWIANACWADSKDHEEQWPRRRSPWGASPGYMTRPLELRRWKADRGPRLRAALLRAQRSAAAAPAAADSN